MDEIADTIQQSAAVHRAIHRQGTPGNAGRQLRVDAVASGDHRQRNSWASLAFNLSAADRRRSILGHPLDVERATQMHVEWCQALIERTGQTTTHQTGPQMRAVMLELRDSLEPEKVLQIANALPALERGIFLDGWSLEKPIKTVSDPDRFFDRVYQRVKNHHSPPPTLVADVFWLWKEKLEPAKARQIFENLPIALRPLWPSPAD